MRALLLALLLLCCTGFTTQVWAWNATGHRVISQIAFSQLTPRTRAKVVRLIHAMDAAYYPVSFSRASTWPDYIKGHGIVAYNHWHYINKPFSTDGTALPSVQPYNVIWAINQAESVEQSPRANAFEKGMFLRFLIHFEEDSHQPLHCANRITHDLPMGDAGGNLYPIRYGRFKNLHALWDDGAGLFRQRFPKRSPTPQQTRAFAAAIMRDYPKSQFGNRINDLNPAHWANESFNIAKQYAYQTPRGARPSVAYIEANQKRLEKRVALAGYRLGRLLNTLVF